MNTMLARLKITLLALCLGAIAGCATPPNRIAAQYVSEIQYRNLSCEELADEQGRIAAALGEAARTQSKAHSGDTVGVLLFGVGTSSLSGSDQAAYVARLKGELEALHRAAKTNECDFKMLTSDEIIESTKSISSAEMKERKSRTKREQMMGR